MSLSQVLAPLIIGTIGTVVATLVAAYVARSKTGAEVENLKAAASVAVSTDNREWAELFVNRADAAERRADAAEHRADEAEEKAESADRRAGELERRADDCEAGLIECYGYVRLLHERLRQHGEEPPALPQRLETLWRGRTA